MLPKKLISVTYRSRGSLGIAVQGRAGFLDYIRLVRRAFPTFTTQIEELVAEGDKVIARLTYTGTHRGELFGISPTGRKVAYSGVAIFRVRTEQLPKGGCWETREG